MKKCKFCAEEIQDDAVVCKHCGRDFEEKKTKKEKKKMGMGKKLLLAIFLFFVVMMIISIASQSPSSNTTGNIVSGNPDKIEAVVMAEIYMKGHLKYPADSAFPGMLDQEYLVNIDGNTYTVTNWVDAANGFGAKERTYYQITLEYLGGNSADSNSWKEVDFKFSE